MKAAIFALAVVFSAGVAHAGPIEQACKSSARAKGNTALCACIQEAADRTLSRGEQRRAAKFFADPHKAQEVRMSKTDADNAFWDRYRGFADMAQAFCAN